MLISLIQPSQDGMMMMMMMRCWCWWAERRCCLYTFPVWALLKLLKRGGGGIIYAVHFPPIVMRCGDTAKSPAIKRRSAQEKHECWRKENDFPLDGKCASVSLNTAGSICPTPEVLTDSIFYTLLSFWNFNLKNISCFFRLVFARNYALFL